MADILVTGGTGQVGTELLRQQWPEGVVLHAPRRAALDLSDPESIKRCLEGRPWSAIISSGAYTAVDRAEAEVEEAWKINALAPALMSHHAARRGIPIIHLSTDYVFDGTKDGYYDEGDPVAPINVYGASKEGGEQAVRSANPRHAIIRTSWVVSPHGSNFVKTMLRLARDRDEVAVVADQFGCPTFASDLARAIESITRQLMDGPTLAGTYHFVNDGEANWSEFAEAVFRESAERGGASANVRAIPSLAYPTPARRPANSRLSTQKLRRAFGIQPRAWEAALRDDIRVLVTRP